MHEEQNKTYPIAEHNKAVGRENRRRIRQWFLDHLCGSQTECAESLGMHPSVVGRHVKAIRSEWRGKNVEG